MCTSAAERRADDETDNPAVRFGGFLDGLPAYTYSPDALVTRRGAAAVDRPGEFADQVKWKLGARVDVDPVYYSSNFYLEPVKKNQRLDVFTVRITCQISRRRLGLSSRRAAESCGARSSGFSLPTSFRRWMNANSCCPASTSSASAGGCAGRVHCGRLTSGTRMDPHTRVRQHRQARCRLLPRTAAVADAVAGRLAVSGSSQTGPPVSNSSYGVRANTLKGGWDLAAFYYRSLSRSPTFYTLPPDVLGKPVTFQPAMTVSTAGWRHTEQGFQRLRAACRDCLHPWSRVWRPRSWHPSGSRCPPTLDYILSAEWTLPGDTRVNVQGFQRVFFGGSVADFVIKSDGFGASLFVSTKLTSTLEPQILWIQNFKDAGGLVRPRLNWSAAKNTTLGFGVDIFTGPADGFFGRFNNRDRLMRKSDTIFEFATGRGTLTMTETRPSRLAMPLRKYLTQRARPTVASGLPRQADQDAVPTRQARAEAVPKVRGHVRRTFHLRRL